MVGTTLNPEAASFAKATLADTRYAKTETKTDPLIALLETLRLENGRFDERESVDDFLARLKAERANISIPRIPIDDMKSVTAHRHKSDTIQYAEKASVKLTSTPEPIEKLQSRARNEGYETGWIKGRDIGYKRGLETGRNHGRSDGFSAGRDRGKKEGIEIGKLVGLKLGIEQGKTLARAENLEKGKTLGKKEGFDEGKAVGKQEGFVEGRIAGLIQGLEEGKDIGFEAGKALGIAKRHEEGKNSGWEEGLEVGQEIAREKELTDSEVLDRKEKVANREGRVEMDTELGRSLDFGEGKEIGRAEEIEDGIDAPEQDITLEEMEHWLEDIKKPGSATGTTMTPLRLDPFNFIFE